MHYNIHRGWSSNSDTSTYSPLRGELLVIVLLDQKNDKTTLQENYLICIKITINYFIYV